MKHPVAPPWLGHEFDNFLFATIGENSNGLPLSVVSMLGRSNLDPWEEAASLIKLPREIATRRLISLLGALRDPSLQQDSGTMAARLIALLPLQAKPRIHFSQPSIRADATAQTRLRTQVLMIGLYMICLLGTELIISHFKPAAINTVPANVSSAAPLQTLPTPYR